MLVMFTTDKIFHICQMPEKNENTGGQCISSLWTLGKPMIWLGRNFCLTFAWSLVYP